MKTAPLEHRGRWIGSVAAAVVLGLALTVVNTSDLGVAPAVDRHFESVDYGLRHLGEAAPAAAQSGVGRLEDYGLRHLQTYDYPEGAPWHDELQTAEALKAAQGDEPPQAD